MEIVTIFDRAIEKLKEVSANWSLSEIYLVGGCVRDELLGSHPIADIDLCIDCLNGGVDFANYLCQNYSDCCKDFAIFPTYGTAKFTLVISDYEHVEVECVMPRTETYNKGPRKPDSVKYATIKDDAMRRDFCCNALYKNLRTSELLDPTGNGLEDIKNKILRTPIDPKDTFIDDPLRMLRAIRFACSKEGFTIEDNTKNNLMPYPPYYELSMERVHDEFSKMMLSDNPVSAIILLHEAGLLDYICPELEESWGFDQRSKYHSQNLTEHLFGTLSFLIKNDHYYPDLNIRLAALFHDIGKYKCFSEKVDGSYRYTNHDVVSSKMTEDILRRLKFSEQDINEVCLYIKNHMIIKQYSTEDLTNKSKVSDRVIRRILRVLPSDKSYFLNNLLRLINADNNNHKVDYCMPDQADAFYKRVEELIYKGKIKEELQLKIKISGDDIMKYFNLEKPCKLVGEIKDIFAQYLDENPELDFQALVNRFEDEFGEKELYVLSRGVLGYVISDIEPKWINEVQYYFVPPTNKLIINSGNFDVKEEHFIKIDAVYYPKLYQRFKNNQEAVKLFYQAANILDKMRDIPGYSGIELSYFDGDLCGSIHWENSEPTEIH